MFDGFYEAFFFWLIPNPLPGEKWHIIGYPDSIAIIDRIEMNEVVHYHMLDSSISFARGVNHFKMIYRKMPCISSNEAFCEPDFGV